MNNKTKYSAAVLAVILGVLATEGGYVFHPSDPGGETNFGITKKTAEQYGYTAPMKEMPKEVAIEIYATSYIENPKFDKVLQLSEPVGTKLIDAGVNTGQNRASKWYQQSLNNFSRNCRDYPCISVDGNVGPATLKAHESLIKTRGKVLSCKILLRSMDAYQGYHYAGLTNLQDFTVGWFSNRIGNVKEDSCNE